MSKNRFLALLFLSVALGFGLGLALRKPLGVSRDSSTTMAGVGDVPASASPGSEALVRPRSGKTRTTRRALEAKTRAHRTLWFATRAEEADHPSFQDLARLAAGDNELVKILAARWADTDLKGMFDTLVSDTALPGREQFLDILFKQWSEKDPEAAIAALSDRGIPIDVRGLRMTVADKVMKERPGIAAEAMQDWRITNFKPDLKRVAKWAEANPDAAMRHGARLDNGYFGEGFLKEVATGLAKNDPESAVRHTDKLAKGQNRQAYAGAAIDEWAEKDLPAAIAFASDPENAAFRADIGGALVAEWGKTDPAAALDWAYANLAGSSRAEATAALIKTVAKEDLSLATEVVQTMEPGGSRDAAVQGLFKQWFEQDKGAQRTEAIAWLGQLGDTRLQREAVDDIRWSWLRDHPDEVVAFSTGALKHMAPDWMIRDLASEQTRKDPLAALQWSEALHEDHRARAQDAVIETWARHQPDNITTWARSQPDAIRSKVVRDVARTLAYRSASAVGSWFEALPESDRATAATALQSVMLKDPAERQRLAELVSRE